MKLGILFFTHILLFAHFQSSIPSKDIVLERKVIEIENSFLHPFTQEVISEDKPIEAKVFTDGKFINLLDKLEKKGDRWILKYKLNRPADYQFVFTNKPYFEKSENKFIKHISKVIINGYKRESNWSEAIGLKAEIIPLTRPYTILEGMLFQGKVLLDGKIVPNAEIEVEYYNLKNRVFPNDMFNTFRIKADENGVFSFVFPFKGWFGFSALLIDNKNMIHNKKEYPVELGALIWIEAK